MFGWFKREPRWRILERANGQHVLQELEFYPGGHGPGISLYDDRGTFPSHQAAVEDIARREHAASQLRVVRETYVD